MKSDVIVWEHVYFPKSVLVKSLIAFFLPSVFIFFFCVALFYITFFNLVFSIGGLILLSIIILLTLFAISPLLFMKSFYSLKFSESTIFIKRRFLRMTKKIELSRLTNIEIIITRRKEMYHSYSWRASSIFLIKLLSSSFEKKYKFKQSCYASKQKYKKDTKQKAIKKRSKFENKLRDLEIHYPNLIMFKDEASPTKEIGWEFWCATLCFITLNLLGIYFFLAFDIKGAIIAVIVYTSLILFCIITDINKCFKVKRKKIKEI